MSNRKFLRAVLLLLALASSNYSSAQIPPLAWQERTTGSDASLRGLSVVDDKTMWASGAKGSVVRTVDGGLNWQSCRPKNFDQLEFRSLVAVDAQIATMASAGTPAVILQTRDGGKVWQEVFRHASTAAFFDGLKFWDEKRGIAFSDPVDGRLLIVTTNDGGVTWQSVAAEHLPLATEKEGGFAASNSALCVGVHGQAWIGTGGTPAATSRVYFTNDFGNTWAVQTCPLPSDSAAGIFSIAASAEQPLLIAVGGDYRAEIASTLTAALSRDWGLSWQLAKQPPTAFVSAICFARCIGEPAAVLIATGPSSSYVSADGDAWEKFSSLGFHALQVSSTGRVYAVGSDGRFGELVKLE